MLVSRDGSHSHLTHPLQDHPPLQRDSIVTDTVRETENIVIEIGTVITGTLVTVTTRKTTGTATEMLAVVVGTRVHPSLPPHLVTTPTPEGLGVVDVTNMTEIGRETMIVETGMDIVEEGGALIAIAITLPLATCTIPRGNIQRGEGDTVAVTMVTAGRREEDMEAIEVVGGAVGVVTEEETGADSLSLEVGVYHIVGELWRSF